MVRGIEKFKEYFKEYSDCYVLIGGTACETLFSSMGIDFRTTKDFDVVLIAEAINTDFVNKFIQFIKDGKYSHIRKSTGNEQFYRFTDPESFDFPMSIELFSKKPNYIKNIDTQLAPIHIDDNIVSLSAILLNNDYYSLIKDGMIKYNDISLLGIEHLVLFKMKAWLDLKTRKMHGENIESKDIKKHKNDIFRLLSIMSPATNIRIDEIIKTDIKTFINQIIDEKPDLIGLNLPSDFDEYIKLIKIVYKI